MILTSNSYHCPEKFFTLSIFQDMGNWGWCRWTYNAVEATLKAFSWKEFMSSYLRLDQGGLTINKAIYLTMENAFSDRMDKKKSLFAPACCLQPHIVPPPLLFRHLEGSWTLRQRQWNSMSRLSKCKFPWEELELTYYVGRSFYYLDSSTHYLP